MSDTGQPVSPPRADPHDNPHLAHHFETPQQQFESGKLGMWIFLCTEVLLFSGLFCAYAVYRALHPEVFRWGHTYLNVWLGGTNTIVLISSSLSMAWAVRAAQMGRQRLLAVCLTITLLGGLMFLGIKYAEYKDKWEEGLLWAGRYKPTPQAVDHLRHEMAPVAAAAPATPSAASGPEGMRLIDRSGVLHMPETAPSELWLFFSIYFLMTGLHGLHVIGGLIVISWLLVRSLRGQFGPAYYTPVDLGGLYWHLVDIIWIFLFPLLYLIR